MSFPLIDAPGAPVLPCSRAPVLPAPCSLLPAPCSLRSALVVGPGARARAGRAPRLADVFPIRVEHLGGFCGG